MCVQPCNSLRHCCPECGLRALDGSSYITSLVTRGLAFRSSYAAAKAALESTTRTMAIELAADGITANAVAPGPTETELFRSNNPQGSEGEARYLSRVPMRRFAHPSEVAAAIAFLAARQPHSLRVKPCS